MNEKIHSFFFLLAQQFHYLDVVLKKQKLMILFICIVSLSLKILLHLLDPTISRDGIGYVQLVQCWHAVRNFDTLITAKPDFWIPPFPLFMMKSLMDMGLSAENAGILLNIACGTFVPLIVYGIAWEISHDYRLSFWSALLAVFHPVINELSVQIQRDAIYLFFAGCAIWALCAGLNRKKWQFFCCSGILTGISLLTRFETLEIVLIATAALFLAALCKDITWMRSGFLCLIFLMSFLLSLTLLNQMMGTTDWILGNYIRYVHWKMDMFFTSANTVFNCKTE